LQVDTVVLPPLDINPDSRWKTIERLWERYNVDSRRGIDCEEIGIVNRHSDGCERGRSEIPEVEAERLKVLHVDLET